MGHAGGTLNRMNEIEEFYRGSWSTAPARRWASTQRCSTPM
jgi:hypothetical protein